jgi:hypothetical protein
MIMTRRMRFTGYVARNGEWNAYRIFVGKPEGTKYVLRFRRTSEDNITLENRMK